MARQIDPWLGVPQTAVLEENLLAVQRRLQRLDIKLSEMEARLGRVARVASEAKADAHQVSGETRQLEGQLAEVAAALLVLTDQIPVPHLPNGKLACLALSFSSRRKARSTCGRRNRAGPSSRPPVTARRFTPTLMG